MKNNRDKKQIAVIARIFSQAIWRVHFSQICCIGYLMAATFIALLTLLKSNDVTNADFFSIGKLKIKVLLAEMCLYI